jgi:hypothetical protein
VAALWQFGGYGQNNASDGAYQAQVGADIHNLANGVLSVDAIYSYVRDAVSASLNVLENRCLHNDHVRRAEDGLRAHIEAAIDAAREPFAKG